MKHEMKLRLEDLQVSSFVAGADRDTQVEAFTHEYASCSCLSWDGRICVTQEFGGGDTCESGPYSYC
jgi:hypothetical protein